MAEASQSTSNLLDEEYSRLLQTPIIAKVTAALPGSVALVFLTGAWFVFQTRVGVISLLGLLATFNAFAVCVLSFASIGRIRPALLYRRRLRAEGLRLDF